MLKNAPKNIRLSDELHGTKDELLRVAQEFGLEAWSQKEKIQTRGRWGLGITPAVMKRCHWVEPMLVAQVKFTEWTLDNQLRQPVFLGLRTDKEAKDVVRE